jgi:RNA recognition motif-containing protein
VKLIKGKDGRNRGFAFVTMSTAEEAAAAVEKLNSHVSVFTVALTRFVCSLHLAVVSRVSIYFVIITVADRHSSNADATRRWLLHYLLRHQLTPLCILLHGGFQQFQQLTEY